MMPKMRTMWMATNKQSRGQAMVEFTVVAGVLLMLILGTIQFALIYHAKTTLSYAAFETARAGSVNNARMWAMELAFARAMAPLYTTPYLSSGDGCDGVFRSVVRQDPDVNPDPTIPYITPSSTDLSLDDVRCARQRVRDMFDFEKPDAYGYARILLVNPSPESFLGEHGYTVAGSGVRYIPNDSLMYRSAKTDALSNQSIQDANLIKVHVSFCYKLVVPLIDRMIWRMIAETPTTEFPENFGAPVPGSFADRCTVFGETAGRYGIPIHAQAVMRMQSDPIRADPVHEDAFCSGCPPYPGGG